MDLGIRGKVALVTASSAGMGRNIALTLAAEGANIVLFARSADKLSAVAAEIEEEHGVKAIAVPGDMLSADDVARLGDVLKQAYEGLDILVLNTGRAPNPLRATLEECDQERWR